MPQNYIPRIVEMLDKSQRENNIIFSVRRKVKKILFDTGNRIGFYVIDTLRFTDHLFIDIEIQQRYRTSVFLMKICGHRSRKTSDLNK